MTLAVEEKHSQESCRVVSEMRFFFTRNFKNNFVLGCAEQAACGSTCANPDIEIDIEVEFDFEGTALDELLQVVRNKQNSKLTKT